MCVCVCVCVCVWEWECRLAGPAALAVAECLLGAEAPAQGSLWHGEGILWEPRQRAGWLQH